MVKELSLRELAKTKNWVEDFHRNRAKEFNPDDILLKTSCHKSTIPNTVTARIGIGVAKKLKIKSGDRVNIFHHPDDLLSFLLVKSTSTLGFIIKYEYRSQTILRLCYRWKRPIVLAEIGYTKMDYIHIPDNNGILFRLPQ